MDEYYSLFFRGNPVPMWITDQENLALLDVNEAAVEKYGF